MCIYAAQQPIHNNAALLYDRLTGLPVFGIPFSTERAIPTLTLVRFEGGEDLKPRTVGAIRAALEHADIIFEHAYIIFIDGEYKATGGPRNRLRAN